MKNKFILPFIIICISSFSGCIVFKKWSSISGCHSNGTIKLTYTYTKFQYPSTSDEEGRLVAKIRCIAWGYHDAHEFDEITMVCSSAIYGICYEWAVTKEYQCTII
ncbi:MAG: hypothetical protein KAG53_08355 [Endozoicomonadaceae bacterium]|nr:hypothetical protein [Endozoicomonadaceae bacterium]